MINTVGAETVAVSKGAREGVGDSVGSILEWDPALHVVAHSKSCRMGDRRQCRSDGLLTKQSQRPIGKKEGRSVLARTGDLVRACSKYVRHSK